MEKEDSVEKDEPAEGAGGDEADAEGEVRLPMWIESIQSLFLTQILIQ